MPPQRAMATDTWQAGGRAGLNVLDECALERVGRDYAAVTGGGRWPACQKRRGVFEGKTWQSIYHDWICRPGNGQREESGMNRGRLARQLRCSFLWPVRRRMTANDTGLG